MRILTYPAPTVKLDPSKVKPDSPCKVSAVPVPDPTLKRDRILIPGDVPSPINPPKGCAFGSRMNSPKYDQSIGRELKVKQLGEGRWVLDCPCCVDPCF